MINFKFLTTILTMLALVFGIIEVQSFLDKNFIKNETPLKSSLNKFLNGNL